MPVKDHPRGLAVKVFVQPRSSKNAITGLHGDAVKLKLTAPPVGGAANKMCVEFLAKRLKLSKSSIEILSGHSGRTKHVLLCCGEDDKKGNERKRLRDLLASMMSG
jgi:uncharacterized protein